MSRWLVPVLLMPLAVGCAPDRWRLFDSQPAPLAAPMAAPTPALEAPKNAPVLPETGPLVLSVQDAILYALANNRDLAVERLSTARVETLADLERGAFDAEFFASAELQQDRASVASPVSGERFDVEREGRTVVVGGRQSLPTGTALEARLSQSRAASDRAPEQQQARVGVTLTQALLRGLRPSVNLARVHIAQLNTLASQQQLRAFASAVVAEAEAAYWQVALAEQRLAIFERSVQIARRQLKDVEARIEIGTLAPIERASPRAEVAQREQALIDAEAAVVARHLALCRVLGIQDPNRKITVRPGELSVAAPVADAAERVRLGLVRRPEVLDVKSQIERGELEVVIGRDGVRPQLDFYLALGHSGYSDSLGGSFGDIGGETYDLSLGLQYVQSVGNRTANAQLRASRASKAQAEAALAGLEQQVRLDVNLALNEVRRAAQQIKASTTTRTLQEEAAEAEVQRFELGDGTALQVAQARRDLLAAEIAEAEAQIQYRLAVLDLHLAEGSLLERRGTAVGQ